MPKTVRTFVAVESPESVRSRALDLIERLRCTQAKVKWVSPDQMHWTLSFLGDVPLDETASICRAVERATAQLAAFTFEARGAGAFPTAHRPRTVWVGGGSGNDHMVQLHDAVQIQLAELGFRAERRRFQPHLTLGRVRNSSLKDIAELGKLIDENDDFDCSSMRVSQVCVFSSRLEPAGPIYGVLGRAELQGN